MNLETYIEDLIKSNKEGTYWDFKLKYHEDKVSLIHDIICLANAEHDGDRYLIFGVEDKTCKIVGVLASECWTQANIIDNLHNIVSFADGSIPDIRLEEIKINEFRLDILIIANTTYKPYYLIKDVESKKKDVTSSPKVKLRAGTIYTRIMDRNTVASSKHIEAMWKERFGLTQSPLEKFKIYLQDCNGWEYGTDNIEYFYKQHPEFTIRKVESNSNYDDHQNEWARGEPGYHYGENRSGCTYQIRLYYHSTAIASLLISVFDGSKKVIVSPDSHPIVPGFIYYYLLDSLDYIYQHFFLSKRNRRGSDDSKNFTRTDFVTKFDIPVFKDQMELNDFIEYFKMETPNWGENEIYKKDGAITNEHKSEQNKLFYQIIDRYNKFRESKPLPDQQHTPHVFMY